MKHGADLVKIRGQLNETPCPRHFKPTDIISTASLLVNDEFQKTSVLKCRITIDALQS